MRLALTTMTVVALLATTAGAQSQPGKPLIDAAADRLNSIAPQGVPQQTIRIGTFDAESRRFDWDLEERYPPGLPSGKRADQGGYVQPAHIAEINSFDVTYEILLPNAPPGTRVALTLQRAEGSGTVDSVASISQGVARVRFNPRTFAVQTLRIADPGETPVSLRVTPHLREQLGAFVVPHLLLTIVYEPPGGRSTASYAKTSTVGTIVSWGFARGTRAVEIVNPEQLNDAFIGAMAAGVGALGGEPAKKAVTTIADLRERHEVTTTTDSTAGRFGASGTSLSVTNEFSTGMHRYPGEGDRFIVMYDVLFVYLAKDGKVLLAPMAYSGVRGRTSAELRSELPPATVEEFLSMNPHFAGGPPFGTPRGTPTLAARVTLSPGRRIPGTRDRFKKFGTIACDSSGATAFELRRTDFRSGGTSETVTTTRVDRIGGLAASMSGNTEEYLSLAYSSAAQRDTSSTEVARVEAWCTQAEGEHEVAIWFDRELRTLLSVKGAPLSAQAMVSGAITDAGGRPRPGERVTLTIGGLRYVARTDARGEYRMRFADMPRGSGTLAAGGRTMSVRLSGVPVSLPRLALSGTAVQEEKTTTTPRLPAAIRPRPRRP